MSDRLQELLHQKALLSEHMAWLEREIALESARTPAPHAQPVAPSSAMPRGDTPETQAAPAAPLASAPATPVPIATGSSADPGSTDPLPGEYRPQPATVQQEFKQGCLRYFVAALVIFGLSVAAIFWFYRQK